MSDLVCSECNNEADSETVNIVSEIVDHRGLYVEVQIRCPECDALMLYNFIPLDDMVKDE